MAKLVLHLGSNLGDRFKYISIAIFFIKKMIGVVLKRSSYYETEAWGNKNQKDFINQAIVVETNLSPEEVLDSIQKIEYNLGRIKAEKWGARIIDIDIIFYDSEIIKNGDLKIPHPELTNRNFVLIPLNEIIPDFEHPELFKTITKILSECLDSCNVRKVNT